LPDKAFREGQPHKIGWLTAWWANPNRKYSGVGMMLLVRALALCMYKYGLGVSDFTKDAQKVYDATRQFRTIRDLPGVSAFARAYFSYLLPKRLPLLAKLRFLLRLADTAANSFFSVRQRLWKRRNKLPEGFRIEYVPEMDPEAGHYIERHQEDELVRRGAKEINWIARFPWVTCVPLGQLPPFYFNSTATTCRCLNIKLYDPNKRLVAVLMLYIIDDHLMVPYCYHDDQADLIALIICHHIIAMRLKRMTTYRPELLSSFSRLRFPWVLQMSTTRSWIMSGRCVEGEGTAFSVQDGDGDCAFTP
jgi:hypothetical protein